MVKNLPANAGDNAGDAGSIPGLGRRRVQSLEEGMAVHSSIFVWRIPWTEELGGATVYRVAKRQTRMEGLSTAHSNVTEG